MTDLLIHGAVADAEGRTLHVTPELAGWRHVGLDAHHLPAGARIARRSEGRETRIVVTCTGSAAAVASRSSASIPRTVRSMCQWRCATATWCSCRADFHAVSMPPGCESHYLNVMAGPLRSWKVTFDPDHAWLLGK